MRKSIDTTTRSLRKRNHLQNAYRPPVPAEFNPDECENVPWGIQPWDDPFWFEGFEVFLSKGPAHRDLNYICALLVKGYQGVYMASRKYHWAIRTRLFDEWRAEQRREAMEAEVIAAERKQLLIARVGLQQVEDTLRKRGKAAKEKGTMPISPTMLPTEAATWAKMQRDALGMSDRERPERGGGVQIQTFNYNEAIAKLMPAPGTTVEGEVKQLPEPDAGSDTE